MTWKLPPTAEATYYANTTRITELEGALRAARDELALSLLSEAEDAVVAIDKVLGGAVTTNATEAASKASDEALAAYPQAPHQDALWVAARSARSAHAAAVVTAAAAWGVYVKARDAAYAQDAAP